MNRFRESFRFGGQKASTSEASKPAGAELSSSDLDPAEGLTEPSPSADLSACPFFGHREYDPVRELFGPALGQVFLARRVSTGRLVVLKLVERGPTVSQFVRSELVFHARCAGQPHILQLLDVFLTDTHLAIVLEHAGAGDLASLVAARGALAEPLARALFQQAASALAFLHSLGAHNREARLESKLLVPGAAPGDPPVVKVQDFAYSKTEQINSDPNSALGSLPYTAPEVLGNSLRGGGAVDVWAAGVALFKLTVGRFPFERAEDLAGQRDVVQKILGRIARAEYDVPDTLSPELRDLLSKMLQRIPEQRLSLQEVTAHPWFVKDCPPYLLAPGVPQKPLWSETELLALIDEASKRTATGLDINDLADEILNEEEMDDLLDELDLEGGDGLDQAAR
ncbi:Serine/threonine-protein kinase SAPK9 [Auxenochlorella protothecoides]|uniref:Serine/threonine-protein kinase SAPK9 n=1 Tax=Auxenochlorella protothecoides TaxID=3075 RepID=A0A087SEN7_AUXPR|nr:Serine/threonine-protein kinase SAPK9 [Auxenochlorella protothecoides]KFM24191.1 Serine/threonine-protein kinase SAPK9 [Auxenochlorella protothecoides]RMZ56195.1 hypothetical protein APUTEX25_002385 [Auxenochlorella protothecoides]|eukprot:RMZ56195.1 hypothetical protein APUTEX25_002385 [Auxenochlorella protothecoides]